VSDRAIDLEEFDRRASNLDERDDHPRTWAVRGNDDFLPAQGVLQVVHLERHMRDGLHEVGNRRTLPVPLPLNAERIALMVTHRDFQVGQIDFPFKASRCRNANVIELHSARPPADNRRSASARLASSSAYSHRRTVMGSARLARTDGT